jgi:hypothetical protein
MIKKNIPRPSQNTITNNIKFIKHLVPLIFNNNDEIVDLSKKKKWKEKSEGLYLIIHGLKSNPYVFGTIITDTIKKNLNTKKYDMLIPKIPFGGNCSLSDASAPIYDLVTEYINKYPKKPIHMIGSSNGCRICSYVETKLRNIDVDIRITALSGAYNGSNIAENYSNILSLVLCDSLITEMKLNSKVNNKLRKKMMSPITKGSRHYEFYVSEIDLIIPNNYDCFPDVNANTKIYHKLVKNTGHVNLAYFKHEKILDDSIEWMSQYE